MGSVKAWIGASGSGIFSSLSQALWVLQSQEGDRDEGKMDALIATLKMAIITFFGTDVVFD